MSLVIDSDVVTGVLLADGWIDALPGSFGLDSYEVVQSGSRVAGGHSWFTFVAAVDKRRVWGPMTSVLALRTGL